MKRSVIILLAIILVITACSQAESPSPTQPPVENPPQPTGELQDAPYPAPGGELPTAPAVNLAYPEPGSELPTGSDVYPEPGDSPIDPSITPFRLVKPVVAGVTEVSGTGPAGVPIMIVDITVMGNILGQGTINDDGTFVIIVPVLEKDHRIGIALDNLDGTPWTPEFFTDAYAGEEAYMSPMIGAFYDTSLVQP
jgi:hypothetical protein